MDRINGDTEKFDKHKTYGEKMRTGVVHGPVIGRSNRPVIVVARSVADHLQ